MNKNALILHAWLNGPQAQWYPWLKTELENRSYLTFLPEIPTMNTPSPNLPEQIAFIEKNIPLSSDYTIIGHSLGSVLSLRLGERHPFSKMILVAGWDFDDLTPEHQSFWPNKLDHELIKKNVKEIYCLSSDNDPYFTAFSVEEMSKRLGAKFILVKGAGHFTKDFGIERVPELLSLI